MSKLILCSGRRAESPYHFKLTGINIYSIEELCYYIYNNIYLITEELFSTELFDWLENEIDMTELAYKLRMLKRNNNSLKDIIVSIMCSCDYYDENEIKYLINIIDEIYNLTPIRRRKIKAVNYLKYGNYFEAVKEFHSILNSKEAKDFTREECGDIYHNLGIATIQLDGFLEASEYFMQAFLRNNNRNSLYYYLYCLKLNDKDELFQKEANHYEVTVDELKIIENNIKKYTYEANNSELARRLIKLLDVRKIGKTNSFYEGVDKMISQWKQEVRGNLWKY